MNLRIDERLPAEWRAFDKAAWIILLLLLLFLLLLWGFGFGPGSGGCCAPAVVAAVPAPVPAPAAVPAPAPAPVVKPVDCATIAAGANVEFGSDSAALTDAGRAVLDQVVGCLGAGHYEIGGHTDSTGDADKNVTLSTERAEAAKAYLVDHGVAADRLTTHGYGASQPVASNETEDGRAQNRRISFKPQ